MQAVIVAAGQGQRIREHHTMPKGFIEVNGTPLIQYSLEILRFHGITDILVVTGYRATCYDQLAQLTGRFDTLYNPHFADYGNLYSFYVARNWIKDDILLVESDIIYEPRAISTLLSSSHENSILTSGPTSSNDEVYVEADDHKLVAMRKDLSQLNQSKVIGEFVGLTRLSRAASTCLFDLCDRDTTMLQDGYYDEEGLVALSQAHPLHIELVHDLQWSEIDNVDQLTHARKLFSDSPLQVQNKAVSHY